MYYYRSIRLLANLLGASKALVVFGYLGVHFEFVPILYKTQTWKKEKESLLCLQKNGRPLYKEKINYVLTITLYKQHSQVHISF
jgi:hypothetical protein